MSANLPQRPSSRPGRDLLAAARLVGRPVAGDQLVHVRLDPPADLGDQLAALVEPLPPLVPPVVEVAGPEAACVCRPGLICDEGRCDYCRTLDPTLPCPHDTFVDVTKTVEAFAAAHGLDPADVLVEQTAGVTVDVGEPVLVLDERDDVDRGIGCWPPVDQVHAAAAQQLAAAGHDVVVDWPAVAGQPLAEVAATTASPATGHLPALNWRGRHDVRSLSFGARARGFAAPAPTLADVDLDIGPVLDQGAEGECVGFGLVTAINALRQTRAAGGLDGQLPLLTEVDADKLYRRAQQLDDRPGESYSGTSVLAGLQAAVEAGDLGGYLWDFGTRDIAYTLMNRRPVVIGVPWLSGMYETGPGGLVAVAGEDTGQGHCLAIVRLRLKGPQGQAGPFFGWQNTWGTSYGAGGIGYVHHRDLAQLLRGTGEAAVPTIESHK